MGVQMPVDPVGGADFTAGMRLLIVAMLLCALAAAGCAGKKNSTSNTAAKAGKPVVKPEDAVVGRVGTVNTIGRFVILSFPTGRMPAQDQQLNIYRRDVKVAEVKVTGPQQGPNVVADIVSGEPQVSDEARD